MSKPSLQERVSDHICEQYQFSNDKVAVMLPAFLDVLQKHMRNMENALEHGGVQAIEEASHTLKGALFNLGLNDIAEIAMTIEKEAMMGNEDINCTGLVKQLQEQLGEIL